MHVYIFIPPWANYSFRERSDLYILNKGDNDNFTSISSKLELNRVREETSERYSIVHACIQFKILIRKGSSTITPRYC
jgi:hypothetical protein